MPKIVRHGCFETNSSSCHSVSVDQTSTEDMFVPHSLYVSDEGSIDISPTGEYGWEIADRSDVRSKIDYLLIYCRDWVNNKSVEENFKNNLSETIRDYVGCSNVNLYYGPEDNFGYSEGYIDHQSVEDGQLDYILENKENIKRFLFAPNSELKTDNDNY